ncbi:MAG TPA: GNAT family N-acetyltransferase [Phototrophicaceae bacterium]|nr:GNAT family N-acetyltransferase [Phototrophicaceae bacterium]
MNVTHFSDPEAFYKCVEPYLLPTEAEHNLTFGLLSNIRQHPERFPDAVMVVVEDQGALQLVALRTDAAHHLILSKAQSLDAIAPLADDLFKAGVVLTGCNGMNAESERFAETWARLNGCTYRINTPMRTFKLEHVNPVAGVSGRLRRATPADRDLLAAWELAFMREAFAEQEHRAEDAARAVDANLNAETAGIFVWDDGGVVSYTAYKGPTPHGIRIGPVYTPPTLRGHGYASACVAGVSQYLLDYGYQFCFLFTDLRNPTSNHIYQVIGYEAVADFTEYMFE